MNDNTEEIKDMKIRLNTNYGLFTSFSKLNDFMIENNISEVEFIDEDEVIKDSKVIQFKQR